MGLSTKVSALIDVVYEWSEALDQGSEVCAVFFDLQKVFDSVPHKSLMMHITRNSDLKMGESLFNAEESR